MKSGIFLLRGVDGFSVICPTWQIYAETWPDVGPRKLPMTVLLPGICRPSLPRHASQAHAFANARALVEIACIVAWRAETKASNGKICIERKVCLCNRSRLIQRAEQAQDGGESKVGERMISVG